MKPMRSVRSSSSGAGGLCDVRIALTPMSRMISSCRSSARVFTAAPRAPRSWCRHTPRIFTGVPLRMNPRSGSNTNVRTPNGVSYSSQGFPPHTTRDTARYRYGRSSDHRSGFLMTRSCAISLTESCGTRASVEAAPTSLPPASYSTVRRTTG